MRKINFLQFTHKPIPKKSDRYMMSIEKTGALCGEDEYMVSVEVKDVLFTMIILKELQNSYDFECFSITEDGKVILTEEDINE